MGDFHSRNFGCDQAEHFRFFLHREQRMGLFVGFMRDRDDQMVADLPRPLNDVQIAARWRIESPRKDAYPFHNS